MEEIEKIVKRKEKEKEKIRKRPRGHHLARSQKEPTAQELAVPKRYRLPSTPDTDRWSLPVIPFLWPSSPLHGSLLTVHRLAPS
jgi:hypothetical protein